MRVNFGHPVSWAVGLGLLGASLAGTIVPTRTAIEELRLIGGYLLIFTPTIYVLISRHATYWERKHPYARFVVFLLTMTIATAVLVQFVALIFDGSRGVTNAAEFIAGIGGFLTTVWMTFYGGAERLWELFLSKTDVEW